MFNHIENYLIFAVTLMLGSLLFLPACYGFDVLSSGEMVKTTIMFREHPVYVTMAGTLTVLGIVSLVFYNKYLNQLRIEVISFLLLIIFNIIFTVDFVKMHGEWTYTLYALFPLFSLILTAVAIYKMVYPKGPEGGRRKVKAGEVRKVSEARRGSRKLF